VCAPLFVFNFFTPAFVTTAVVTVVATIVVVAKFSLYQVGAVCFCATHREYNAWRCELDLVGTDSWQSQAGHIYDHSSQSGELVELLQLQLHRCHRCLM
jgi:hypothetical protein